MLLRVKQFTTLATLTAVEAIRQPICLLLTTTCVILTAAMPMLLLHNFGEDGRLARDTGLALHFVIGLFVAGYAACSSLSHEMRSGTASAVLSKPVGKEIFFLAKFAGIAAVVLAFSLCATIATLVGERVSEHFVMTKQIVGYYSDWWTGNMLLAAPFVAYLLAGLINYKFRRPFESTAFYMLIVCILAVFLVSAFFNRMGQFAPFDFRVQWRIIPASVLITTALLILAAIALSLSTRLGTVATLTFCVVLFMLGLMSDYLFGRSSEQNLFASAAHLLLPNWQHFWMSDALRDGGRIPISYVLAAGRYAAIYLVGILCLGVASFRHAEMK